MLCSERVHGRVVQPEVQLAGIHMLLRHFALTVSGPVRNCGVWGMCMGGEWVEVGVHMCCSNNETRTVSVRCQVHWETRQRIVETMAKPLVRMWALQAHCVFAKDETPLRMLYIGYTTRYQISMCEEDYEMYGMIFPTMPSRPTEE